MPSKAKSASLLVPVPVGIHRESVDQARPDASEPVLPPPVENRVRSRSDFVAVLEARLDEELTFIDPPRQDGLGNAVVIVGEGSDERVLKVYRPKMSAIGSLFANTITCRLQCRRKMDPLTRARTETVCIELWQKHGFDVFSIVEGVALNLDSPTLWLEYCPGRLLSDVLSDPELAVRDKENLVARVGSESARRHQLAIRTSNILLVHFNSSVKHIMHHGDRLTTFDFEGGYVDGLGIEGALSLELGSFLRSLERFSGSFAGKATDAYREGYADPDLLGRIANRGIRGLQPYLLGKRFGDSLRPRSKSKTESLRRLRDRLTV